MHPNETLIRRFYEAFQERNYGVMQRSYHKEASFYDPVFQLLPANEVRMMWQMLLTGARDLKVTCSNVAADDYTGKCRWEAWYTFTATGRPVHNVIDASFEFKDGKIFTHHDQFDFYRWARMALGVSGVLLGWSPLLLKKVQKTARRKLDRFIEESTKVAA
jgi:hypothetical protein